LTRLFLWESTIEKSLLQKKSAAAFESTKY